VENTMKKLIQLLTKLGKLNTLGNKKNVKEAFKYVY